MKCFLWSQSNSFETEKTLLYSRSLSTLTFSVSWSNIGLCWLFSYMFQTSAVVSFSALYMPNTYHHNSYSTYVHLFLGIHCFYMYEDDGGLGGMLLFDQGTWKTFPMKMGKILGKSGRRSETWTCNHLDHSWAFYLWAIGFKNGYSNVKIVFCVSLITSLLINNKKSGWMA